MATTNPYPQTARLAELVGVELAPVLSVAAVARLLHVAPSTVTRWTREGKLPALVVGGVLRVEAADLERFLGRRG